MSTAAQDFAQKYLEDLLSFFGLNTSIDVSKEDETITLQVPSTHLNGFLIGNHGENLRSLQHLTNMALKTSGYEDTMAIVDVAGYRQQRNERLTKHAQSLAQKVLAEGQDIPLEPMSAYDRRVVHQAVSEIAGVKSESDGEGRERHIVIKPKDQEETDG